MNLRTWKKFYTETMFALLPNIYPWLCPWCYIPVSLKKYFSIADYCFYTAKKDANVIYGLLLLHFNKLVLKYIETLLYMQ